MACYLQLIFVFVEMDNEDVGKPVSEYFGITGDAPTVFSLLLIQPLIFDCSFLFQYYCV